jgi:hypothetical protein
MPNSFILCDFMVRPERFELPTFWFVARRSIQLSYGRLIWNEMFTANEKPPPGPCPSTQPCSPAVWVPGK